MATKNKESRLKPWDLQKLSKERLLTGTLNGHERATELIRRQSQYLTQNFTDKKTIALTVNLPKVILLLKFRCGFKSNTPSTRLDCITK